MKGLNEDFIVEKSNDIVNAEMAKCDLTMLKLMDIYLSKINARDPSSARVEFTKQEFLSLMNLHPKSKLTGINQACDNLMTLKVNFAFKTSEETGIRKAILFNTCDIVNREGRVIIRMCANPDVQWLFFDLKEKGYTAYALKNTIGLTSKYSLLLYQNLRMQLSSQHKKEASKKYELDTLREMLGIQDSYVEFKKLRTLLDECITELNEKTDTRIEMEVIKNGTKAVAVRFTIRAKKNEKHLDTIPEDDEVLDDLSKAVDRCPVVFDLTEPE